MRPEIENRLHRVKISFIDGEVRCPRSSQCDKAENSFRCNLHFSKCSKFRIYPQDMHSKSF
ncbi:MAG: hypothetical protein KGD73_12995 [Candidatus Lokiarchaeota archaeon]|nr:hypothetical protein [Candidatus Lokiarchaeota archaeon]